MTTFPRQACHNLSLCGTTLKKVLSRLVDCSCWKSSGYWHRGVNAHNLRTQTEAGVR